MRTFPVLRDRNGYVRGYLPYLSFDLPLILRLLFARRPSVVVVEPPPTTGAILTTGLPPHRQPTVPPAAVGVRVRVPAKINLALKVGPPRPDGYHPLATVYHAVSLFDDVHAEWADPDEFELVTNALAFDGTTLSAA